VSVKQNGTLELMSHAELQNYAYIYAVCGSFIEALADMNIALDVAGAIAGRAPGGTLSPQDIDELIVATSQAKRKLVFAARILGFEEKGLQRVQ
jgi:hypothetical protein